MAEQTNAFVFQFKGSDIQKLAADAPDYVLITVATQTYTVDGKSIAGLNVVAESFKKAPPEAKVVPGSISRLDGCPVPPCIPGGGLG